MARVADYEFNGTPNTGGATDSSGGGHHGSMQGDAHLDGRGNAVFDGSDHVVIKPDAAFALSEGTVIIEFTQTTASDGKLPWGSDGAQTLFSVDAYGTKGGGHLSIFIRADGQVGVRHQTETQDHFYYGGSVVPGQPASIGYSWGPNGSTLIVNGKTVASGTEPLFLAGDHLPMVLGASQAQSTAGTTDQVSSHFDGTISRVQIHDTAVATDTPVPCFAAGTLIATPRGEVPIETLKPGDAVLTLDDGPQVLRHVSHHAFRAVDLAARAQLRPIRIEARALGNHSPLLVSRQHAMLLAPRGVLVRAIHLTRHDDGRFRIMKGCRRIDYHHLLFDRHQIVFANGAPAESLLPDGRAGLSVCGPVQVTARPILSGSDARRLLCASAMVSTRIAAPDPGDCEPHAATPQ